AQRSERTTYQRGLVVPPHRYKQGGPLTAGSPRCPERVNRCRARRETSVLCYLGDTPGLRYVDREGGWTTMLSAQTAWGENPALSYRNLRAIIGYIGLTLPVTLLLAGLADGHIESSISAYYYTKVGNVFTGALCVI